MLHCLVMENALRDAWLKGSGPRLGAKGEALAWALRVAWRAQSHGDHGMLTFVQQNVPKMDGEPPRLDALSALSKKIDRDEAWFPGKLGGRGAGGQARSDKPGEPSRLSQEGDGVEEAVAAVVGEDLVSPTACEAVTTADNSGALACTYTFGTFSNAGEHDRLQPRVSSLAVNLTPTSLLQGPVEQLAGKYADPS